MFGLIFDYILTMCMQTKNQFNFLLDYESVNTFSINMVLDYLIIIYYYNGLHTQYFVI